MECRMYGCSRSVFFFRDETPNPFCKGHTLKFSKWLGEVDLKISQAEELNKVDLSGYQDRPAPKRTNNII
jgi:hypothetical protein